MIMAMAKGVEKRRKIPGIGRERKPFNGEETKQKRKRACLIMRSVIEGRYLGKSLGRATNEATNLKEEMLGGKLQLHGPSGEDRIKRGLQVLRQQSSLGDFT